MKRIAFAVCGVILLFGLITFAQTSKPRASSYSLTLIESPYSTQTLFTGINEPHRGVGYGYTGSAGSSNPNEVVNTRISFQWLDGAFTRLNPAGLYLGSNAAAQNNSCAAVGSSMSYVSLPPPYSFIKTIIQEATLWQGGNATIIGPPGQSSSWAMGINGDGKVAITAVSVTPAFQSINSSWVWQDGDIVQLSDPRSGACTSAAGINDPGQVVGTSCGNSSYKDQALLWTDGVGQLLGTLQGVDTAGNAIGSSNGVSINNRGQAVGSSTFSNTVNGTHPFLWDRGVMQDLFQGANDIAGSPFAINNSTQVVGQFKKASDPMPHAFIWDNGQLYDLNAITTQRDPLVVLYMASGINERGQISGLAIDWRGTAPKFLGFLLTPDK